jgi:hypothetical protein
MEQNATKQQYQRFVGESFDDEDEDELLEASSKFNGEEEQYHEGYGRESSSSILEPLQGKDMTGKLSVVSAERIEMCSNKRIYVAACTSSIRTHGK